MSRLSHCQKVVAIAFFLLAVVPQFILIFWTVYPYDPLRIDSINILSKVEVGQPFTYKLTGEKYTDLPGTISRQFVNGLTISMPAVSSNINKGTKELISSFILPYLPIGKYYLKWSATYNVNPVRSITVTGRSECFEIKK